VAARRTGLQSLSLMQTSFIRALRRWRKLTSARRPRASRSLRQWLWPALLLWVPAAGAQIYAGIDATGSLVLSNHPVLGDTVQLIVAAPVASAAPDIAAAEAPAGVGADTAASSLKEPLPIARIIRDAAKRHALPEGLLRAVVAVESAFDSRAVSPKGAKGLMQLMPDTARRFGVKDVFSADQNVHAGAAYLRLLLNQFADDLPLALAAYNAGEGAVLRAGRRIPPYPETERYVRKVLVAAALPSERRSSLAIEYRVRPTPEPRGDGH
jgi:soluble lytic murein transglycosylase-like protein